MSATEAGLILVVDDEPGVRLVLAGLLRQLGHASIEADSARSALAQAEQQPVEVVISDLQMPGEDGFWLLAELRRRIPFVPVVMLTAHASVENAVRALQQGAFDFLTKPVDRTALERALEKALPQSDRQFRDGARLEMVAESPAMRQVLGLCERMAGSPAPVLITGPSGSGKEVVARALHARGGAERPFVALNCAAIPEGLLESELFGHVRGAFTGATCDKPGRVELAEGGTLFLDEVGDLPLALQVKLLRLVQERCYEPVGGLGTRVARIRIVAATHRNLAAMVQQEHFREDLFFRLNVLPIALSPLRERLEDLAPLARAFLSTACLAMGRDTPQLDDGAIQLLAQQDWPGNARELGNLMERVAALCQGPGVHAEDLQACLTMGAATATPIAPSTAPEDERARVRQALEQANGNRTLAARLLGVSRRTLYNRLERYELS